MNESTKSVLREGLGPLPAQWPQQAHTMSVCISTAHDGGHWYSPAAVQERIDAAVAAERARIDAAPTAIMDTRDVLGLCAPAEDDFPALYALQGHRVALVDLGLPATDPRFHGLPPYPEGEVVGPCACGSWPGGRCLRCLVTPNA